MRQTFSVILAFLLAFLIAASAPFNAVTVLPDGGIIAPEPPVDSAPPETDNKSPNQSEAPIPQPDNTEPTKTPDTPPEIVVPEDPAQSGAALPELNTQTAIVSKHTALSKNQYYQYSFLSPSEKEVYNKLCSAAEKGVSNVDLEKYELSKQTIEKIHNAFTADNPQYFYLSKYYSYVISSKTGKILEFQLYYSDGSTEDNFDDNGNSITTADRDKINAQITAFNKKVSEILKSIPSNIPDLEKEKKLYEYILDNVSYDKSTADAVKLGTDTINHSFDAYGAACEGVAVCEGYAKLFQYLCYQVGINATQVHGASGTYHMWNAVLIGGSWYMADPTWDDSGENRLHYYRYFNITTAELETDHYTDTKKLQVPVCTNTAAAFYNNFALNPKSNSDLPSNYAEVIDYIALNGDKFICVYRGENSTDLSDFINNEIYSPKSSIQKYIKENNYGIILADQFYVTDQYYYIPLV